MTPEPHELEAQGKSAFANKKFDEAAQSFRQAAEGYIWDAGLIAEMIKRQRCLVAGGKPRIAGGRAGHR